MFGHLFYFKIVIFKYELLFSIFMIHQWGMKSTSFEKLESEVRKYFPKHEVYVDSKLRLFEDLVNALEIGTKEITIRTYKGKVRIPQLDDLGRLPIYQTTPKDPQAAGELVGHIFVPYIVLALRDDFPEELSQLDGYENNKQMIEDLSQVYGEITKENVISAYKLQIFDRIK